MTLEHLKKMLDECGFSPDVHAAVGSIMDAAIERGEMTDDERKKLIALIDLDIDIANLEAESSEDAASALSAYVHDIDEAMEHFAAELRRTDEALQSELHAITSSAASA